MFNLKKIFSCFKKKEPLYDMSIFKHRTWLEREVQEQLFNQQNEPRMEMLLNRDCNSETRSDNWYDKYIK